MAQENQTQNQKNNQPKNSPLTIAVFIIGLLLWLLGGCYAAFAAFYYPHIENAPYMQQGKVRP